MRSGRSSVVVLLLTALAQACGTQQAQPGVHSTEVGSTKLQLTLPDGRVVHTVDWEIEGGALSEPMAGAIDVGDEEDSVSAHIGGIPVAPDYQIWLSAEVDAETCHGSAGFDISGAGATALVDVTLYCGSGSSSGNLVVNAGFSFDACPATSMVVSPLQVAVGDTIELSATGEAGVSYEWTASGGAIDDPTAAHAVLSCTEEGTVDLTLTTEAGECSQARTAQITCGPASAEHDEEEHDEEEHDEEEHEVTEVASAQPRVVLTYDGGLVVLDGTSLETLADFPLAGFNRINSVGTERHVAVSTTGGWLLVDAGAWTEPHGDHTHSYTTEPAISEIIVAAETPAHVVVHDGYTALFDDGTGEVTIVEVAAWFDAMDEGHAEVTRAYTSDAAHHGVAVLNEEGHLLVTLSDRSGAMLLDENDEVIVTDSSCPGVHGETAFDAADGNEYMMVGCQDGVLLFDGEDVNKLASPDTYGRIGNQFSSEGSDIVLGDYRNDPDAGLGVPLIALINVVDQTLEVVDPFEGADVVTTWRGLRRGDQGEILVLGTDGGLRVIEPTTGQVLHTIAVISPWQVPEEWQTAHPALDVAAGTAYVTEPATGTIYAVDYVNGVVTGSAAVGVEMNEIVGVEG